MAVLPDLRALTAAAAAVERTATDVEADADSVVGLLHAIPWTGPRRERVLTLADAAVATGRGQAATERALAQALRQLAAAVEHELAVLAALAARARRHLEELAARARALATLAAQELADVLHNVVTLAIGVVTGDPTAPIRAARALVDRAETILLAVTRRLQLLPAVYDPAWRTLGDEILRWQPL